MFPFKTAFDFLETFETVSGNNRCALRLNAAHLCVCVGSNRCDAQYEIFDSLSTIFFFLFLKFQLITIQVHGRRAMML